MEEARCRVMLVPKVSNNLCIVPNELAGRRLTLVLTLTQGNDVKLRATSDAPIQLFAPTP